MSERDVKRVEVLNEVHSGRRTVAAAASVLDISERQAYRLLPRYQENGGFGLVHKARGRTSNRSHNPGIRKFPVELVRTHFADFGPILAIEALSERHGVIVGREKLRTWMLDASLWLHAPAPLAQSLARSQLVHPLASDGSAMPIHSPPYISVTAAHG